MEEVTIFGIGGGIPLTVQSGRELWNLKKFRKCDYEDKTENSNNWNLSYAYLKY